MLNTNCRTLALLATCAVGAPCHAGVLIANAITNGGAESYTYVDPSQPLLGADFTGWTRTGPAVIDDYLTFPVHFVNPGAEQFGLVYFVGGNGPSSQLTQTISVSGVAALIDAGNVGFELRGWLGSLRQSLSDPVDSLDVTLIFLNALNQDLGHAGFSSPNQAELTSLGSPVNNGSWLVLRDSTGFVPAGTRSVEVSLLFTRQAGMFSNGSADNLSLTLSSVPEPSTWVSMAIGCAAITLVRSKMARKAKA